jgi:hypothetical protein
MSAGGSLPFKIVLLGVSLTYSICCPGNPDRPQRRQGKESEFLVEHYLPEDDGDNGDEGSDDEEK